MLRILVNFVRVDVIIVVFIIDLNWDINGGYWVWFEYY